jgi:hypothetical protein
MYQKISTRQDLADQSTSNYEDTTMGILKVNSYEIKCHSGPL